MNIEETTCAFGVQRFGWRRNQKNSGFSVFFATLSNGLILIYQPEREKEEQKMMMDIFTGSAWNCCNVIEAFLKCHCIAARLRWLYTTMTRIVNMHSFTAQHCCCCHHTEIWESMHFHCLLKTTCFQRWLPLFTYYGKNSLSFHRVVSLRSDGMIIVGSVRMRRRAVP